MLTSFSIMGLLQAIVPPDKLPEIISIILGVVSSVIVQFVKGKFSSMTTRFIFAVLLSIVVGVAAYIFAAPPDSSLVVFVIHVFGYSQIAYGAFWKVIWEDLFKFQKVSGK